MLLPCLREGAHACDVGQHNAGNDAGLLALNMHVNMHVAGEGLAAVNGERACRCASVRVCV